MYHRTRPSLAAVAERSMANDLARFETRHQPKMLAQQTIMSNPPCDSSFYLNRHIRCGSVEITPHPRH